MRKSIIAALALLFFLPLIGNAGPGRVFFREDFNSLTEWKDLNFKKIKIHTRYSIEGKGKTRYLTARADHSASGLIYSRNFKPADYPVVQWRWKIAGVYKKGDARKKAGDDYPIRIYIVFKYNPKEVSAGTRFKYNLVKMIYGEYPPHSSLNYIWANRDQGKRIVTSPYTERAKLIILESGPARAGTWVTEKVNILDDYRKAFGTDPPAVAGIAVMADADNTGEKGTSYIDYIEVARK